MYPIKNKNDEIAPLGVFLYQCLQIQKGTVKFESAEQKIVITHLKSVRFTTWYISAKTPENIPSQNNILYDQSLFNSMKNFLGKFPNTKIQMNTLLGCGGEGLVIDVKGLAIKDNGANCLYFREKCVINKLTPRLAGSL